MLQFFVATLLRTTVSLCKAQNGISPGIKTGDYTKSEKRTKLASSDIGTNSSPLGGGSRCWHEGEVVRSDENQSSNPDVLFWVQFALLWERLAEMSHLHRFEYLSKARACLARAEIIRSELSRSGNRNSLVLNE